MKYYSKVHKIENRIEFISFYGVVLYDPPPAATEAPFGDIEHVFIRWTGVSWYPAGPTIRLDSLWFENKHIFDTYSLAAHHLIKGLFK